MSRWTQEEIEALEKHKFSGSLGQYELGYNDAVDDLINLGGIADFTYTTPTQP